MLFSLKGGLLAMDLNLEGKRVIVTGGTRGLGKAISEAFAREGASVAMNFIGGEENADKTLDELRDKYSTLLTAIKADITVEEQVCLLFDEAEKALGDGIDILINNAGICPVTDVLDTPYELWKRVIDVNFNSVFLMSKEFVKRRIEAGVGGRITNIASQAAFNGSKRGKTHYAASKGALVSFTLSFAKEVAKYGIYVNAVAPGMMFTDLTKETLSVPGEQERYNAAITLGRIAEVGEVAESVLFISSEVASYSTGSTFDVSGGIMSR